MKKNGEIDQAFRELAQERDKLLDTASAFSATRREALSEFLVRELQPAAMLRTAARNRDQLLEHPPQISISIESALHRQLRARRAGPRQPRTSFRRFGAKAWQRFFPSPAWLMITVCLVTTAAILCFRQSGTSSRRDTDNVASVSRSTDSDVSSDEDSLLKRGELLTRWASIRAFKLNTDEPASLQASFLASSAGYFIDGKVPPFDLRLDLPVRTIFLEDGFARTP